MEYLKPFVIAEIGCNHKGDMDIAKRLIRTAAIYCEVDAGAIGNCLLPNSIMRHTRIQLILTERHTGNTENFWNLR